MRDESKSSPGASPQAVISGTAPSYWSTPSDLQSVPHSSENRLIWEQKNLQVHSSVSVSTPVTVRSRRFDFQLTEMVCGFRFSHLNLLLQHTLKFILRQNVPVNVEGGISLQGPMLKMGRKSASSMIEG